MPLQKVSIHTEILFVHCCKFFLLLLVLSLCLLKMGTCKVRNEIETKRNRTKRNETDRNETKSNETKRNRSKRNETKRNDVTFRFVSFRSVSFRSVSFRFVSISFRTLQVPYFISYKHNFIEQKKKYVIFLDIGGILENGVHESSVCDTGGYRFPNFHIFKQFPFQIPYNLDHFFSILNYI
jgi:hypothetical protein